MEEISFPDAFDSGDIGMALLDAVTGAARTEGVQIGIPWTKEVYDYLFEASPEADIEEILGLVPASSFGDTDMF